jgi:F0F1-type ATP synthase alpha subunit
MPVKEITLEELIAKQQEHKAKQAAMNAENIAKIIERAAAASGAEKVRLENLVKLHENHKLVVEAIDPVAVATERFNKIKKN